MPRLTIDRVRRGDLDNAPEVHDRDAVGDMFHHCQIVRDEKITEAQFPLEIQEEVDDLTLNRDIEG